MNRDDELWANVRRLVDMQRAGAIYAIRDVVLQLHHTWPVVGNEELLSTSYIDTLRTAAAWHHHHSNATERLTHLNERLKHFEKRAAANPTRQQFYTELRRLLWLGGTAPWSDIERKLNLADEEAHWHEELRLHLAVMVLDTLVAFYDTRQLQLELQQHEGGWQWP